MFHLLATSVHIPRDNNQDEFPHNGKQDIYDTDAMKKAKRDLVLGHWSPVSPIWHLRTVLVMQTSTHLERWVWRVTPASLSDLGWFKWYVINFLGHCLVCKFLWWLPLLLIEEDSWFSRISACHCNLVLMPVYCSILNACHSVVLAIHGIV